MKTILVILYIYKYVYFVVGNYLVDPDDLISHHMHDESSINHYTNVWYFQTTKDLNKIHADILPKGFSYAEPIKNIPNTYKVKLENHPEINSKPNQTMTDILNQHHLVDWAQQDFMKNLYIRDHEIYERSIPKDFWKYQWYEQKVYRKYMRFNIPFDLNIGPVYKNLKLSGRGVRVAIIDDGLDHAHDDLKDNYDPEISINLNWRKMDPTPRKYNGTGRINNHGTRCAGEIAMSLKSHKCGVGIAYNAKIGGIVLLDGPVNDEAEALAISNANHLVDIYSGSWGPKDDGTKVQGPGPLSQKAMNVAMRAGRGGLGSLYLFASGNGRLNYDNCAADGYVGSIYTLAFSSVRMDGTAPPYAERCAGVMGTAYSGGSDSSIKIVTTDLNNTCTTKHSGTSAAVPVAAGVIALALEANEHLTWRDIHHLFVRNCKYKPLEDNADWITNAAGFHFNPQFGFGLIDAYSLVKEAMHWRSVPMKSTCVIDLINSKNFFGRKRSFFTKEYTNACMGSIKHLEHVELDVTIQYPKRGFIEIELVSPSNTKCKMMEARIRDLATTGLVDWKIKSLQFWGENPIGNWKVMVEDNTSPLYDEIFGSVDKIQLILHGTQRHPYVS